MAKHKVQAQKTLWVETEIEAPTEAEALEIAREHFAVVWHEVYDSEEFSGVFWTEEAGLIDDPKEEVFRLEKIVKKIKALLAESEEN